VVASLVVWGYVAKSDKLRVCVLYFAVFYVCASVGILLNKKLIQIVDTVSFYFLDFVNRLQLSFRFNFPIALYLLLPLVHNLPIHCFCGAQWIRIGNHHVRRFFTWRWKQSWLPKYCVCFFLIFGRWTKSKKKKTASVRHTPSSKSYSAELIYIIFKN